MSTELAVPIPPGGPPPGGRIPVLEEIYRPIATDMERLSKFLRDEFAQSDPFILDLLAHVARYQGKQIRPALLLLIGKYLGGRNSTEQVKLAAVVELIHTATLVHDDILDDAALRRNVETLHRRWGERSAVLMGDFIYSRAFHLSTQVAGAAEVLSRTTNTICEGELLQIGSRWRPDLGEALYFEIIRKKTAVLYAVAGQLGAMLAGAAPHVVEAIHDYGMEMGMAFQIVDDCLDYAGDEAKAGKSLGTDLRGGKTTLPLLYCLEGLPVERASAWREALRGPLSADLQKEISREVRERGALRESLDRARAFIASARSRTVALPSELRERLDLVADYVLLRQR